MNLARLRLSPRLTLQVLMDKGSEGTTLTFLAGNREILARELRVFAELAEQLASSVAEHADQERRK